MAAAASTDNVIRDRGIIRDRAERVPLLDRIAVLDDVLAGHPAQALLARHTLPGELITAVLKWHGYPDRKTMQLHRDALAADLASGDEDHPRASTPPEPTVLAPVACEHVALLERGAKSRHARARTLAARAGSLLTDLAELVDGEERRARESKEREAKRKKLRAEIDRLQDKLRRLKSTTTTAGSHVCPVDDCSYAGETAQGLAIHTGQLHKSTTSSTTKE